jgi:hypothetical protein
MRRPTVEQILAFHELQMAFVAMIGTVDPAQNLKHFHALLGTHYILVQGFRTGRYTVEGMKREAAYFQKQNHCKGRNAHQEEVFAVAQKHAIAVLAKKGKRIEVPITGGRKAIAEAREILKRKDLVKVVRKS